MTTIQEIKRKDRLVGFHVSGHAGYLKRDDIVCAAISVLTINAINSLDEIANAPMKQCDTGAGDAVYEIRGKPSAASETILQVTKLGYKTLAETYGNYITYVE